MTGTYRAIFALTLSLCLQVANPALALTGSESTLARGLLRAAQMPDMREVRADVTPAVMIWPAIIAPIDSVDPDELFCLTEALYFEARGESLTGVFGVAEVILNRRDSGAYPDTVCGVVNQGVSARLYTCQFSYNCDGLPETISEPEAWDRVERVARTMLADGPRHLTKGATHYHTTYVSPSWASRIPQTAQIGAHLFYREPVRTASN